MDCSLGQVVISKQGRDNGTVYVVLKMDASYCYVADGRKTTYQRPKKKNEKHLQVTHWISAEIKEALALGKAPTDAEIRGYLNDYRSK